ncbi:MAG: SH3-like domain-containing protein [Candidatus Aquilonibacter sp.]
MRFEPGSRVQTRGQRPQGHTRLPRYLEMRPGTVVRRIGEFPLSDEWAERKVDARKDVLYTVEFKARDVWGFEARDGDVILADLFETYLEPEQ